MNLSESSFQMIRKLTYSLKKHTQSWSTRKKPEPNSWIFSSFTWATCFLELTQDSKTLTLPNKRSQPSSIHFLYTFWTKRHKIEASSTWKKMCMDFWPIFPHTQNTEKQSLTSLPKTTNSHKFRTTFSSIQRAKATLQSILNPSCQF